MPQSRHALTLLAASVVLLSACTHADPSASSTSVPANTPKADDVLAKVADAMSKLDPTVAPVSGSQDYPKQDVAAITKGMGGLKPTVKPGTITYKAAAKTAEGELNYSWPTYPKPWEYKTNVRLILVDGHWQWQYDPSAVQANVSAASKLVAERQYAPRGAIISSDGPSIVETQDVVQVGIDKTIVTDPGEQDTSARQLAKLLKIDENNYATQVKNAGAKAFVLGTTLRSGQVPSEVGDIKGARGIPGKMMLGPTKTFGQPAIGTVGSPSQETIDKSKGAIDADSMVGQNGLQSWHDKDLRGTDGVRISLVARDQAAQASASPTPGAPTLPSLLYKIDPVDGAAMKISMNINWQTKAEAALADMSSPSAIAMVQPSTGKIVALAVSPSANNQPLANWSKNPPGSTFKVVSTLALLRSGLTPDSKVDCPTEVSVNGQRIHNYPGYPADHNGSIPLRDALAYSCNTAFVNATKSLPKDSLKKAAASLGIGVDYDPGFESYFGDVPVADSDALMAADSFGQGTVQVSPMALAGMVASVAAGHTVIPSLIDGKQPSPAKEVAPLTPAEAQALQSAMGSVSSYGSTKDAGDILVGGKTGTAEYGPADNIKTHIWLVGYTKNDVAIAVFSQDGNYGSDLIPVVKKVFS